MRVQVRYFAQARDLAGVGEEHLQIPEGADVGALWEEILSHHQSLRALGDAVSLVVGRIPAGRAQKLAEGQAVSVIPPVSGG